MRWHKPILALMASLEHELAREQEIKRDVGDVDGAQTLDELEMEVCIDRHGVERYFRNLATSRRLIHQEAALARSIHLYQHDYTPAARHWQQENGAWRRSHVLDHPILTED